MIDKSPPDDSISLVHSGASICSDVEEVPEECPSLPLPSLVQSIEIADGSQAGPLRVRLTSKVSSLQTLEDGDEKDSDDDKSILECRKARLNNTSRAVTTATHKSSEYVTTANALASTHIIPTPQEPESKRPSRLLIETLLFPEQISVDCLCLANVCCCCLLSFIESDEEDNETVQNEGTSCISISSGSETTLCNDEGSLFLPKTSKSLSTSIDEASTVSPLRVRTGDECSKRTSNCSPIEVDDDDAFLTTHFAAPLSSHNDRLCSEASSSDMIIEKPMCHSTTEAPKPLSDSTSWVGLISSCRHTFHFDCITRWAARENTCPQCKVRFRVIGVYNTEGTRIRYRLVKKVDQKPLFHSEEGDDDENLSDPGDSRNACFICHSLDNSTGESLMHCDGAHGHCDESCHRSCLGLPPRVEDDDRDFFCPTCIRRNKCINADGERTLDPRPLIVNFQLPTIIQSPIETIGLSNETLQPFLDLYQHLDVKQTRKGPKTRASRRGPITVAPSRRRGTTRVARVNSGSTTRARRSARTARPPNRTRDRCQLITSLFASASPESTATSGSAESRHRHSNTDDVAENIISAEVSALLNLGRRRGRRRARLTPEEIEEQQEHRAEMDLNVDETEPERLPPLRGVPSDFAEYEEYERRMLGNVSFGMSRHSSRIDDGGACSGRDFLADLLSSTPQEENCEISATCHSQGPPSDPSNAGAKIEKRNLRLQATNAPNKRQRLATLRSRAQVTSMPNTESHSASSSTDWLLDALTEARPSSWRPAPSVEEAGTTDQQQTRNKNHSSATASSSLQNTSVESAHARGQSSHSRSVPMPDFLLRPSSIQEHKSSTHILRRQQPPPTTSDISLSDRPSQSDILHRRLEPQLKPPSPLVEAVKFRLKRYNFSRDDFKKICKAACESLLRRHVDTYQNLPPNRQIDFWKSIPAEIKSVISRKIHQLGMADKLREAHVNQPQRIIPPTPTDGLQISSLPASGSSHPSMSIPQSQLIDR